MDAMYDVGDSIFILAEVKSVEELENDNRYMLTTGLAKFYANDSTDTFKRNPNTDETKQIYTALGEANMYEYMYNASQLDEEQLQECFGANSLVLAIQRYKDDINQFKEKFDIWWAKYNTKVGFIVLYEDNECVVMNTLDTDNDGKIDKYIIYDPDDIKFYTVERTDFSNTGKVIDIEKYIQLINEEVENAESGPGE